MHFVVILEKCRECAFLGAITLIFTRGGGGGRGAGGQGGQDFQPR